MRKVNSRFKIDWVLVNELAIGSAPRKETHLVHLKELGIKSILSLCGEEEVKIADNIKNNFHFTISFVYLLPS